MTDQDDLEDPRELLTLEELSEVLADAEGTTPEEIERGAAEIDIAPPEEATVVGYGGFGPLTASDDE